MILKLQMNENPYQPDGKICTAAISGLENINRYSELEYLNELKELIGKYNNNFPSEQIVLSHGSDIILREIINVFSKDRKIMMMNPSYFPVSRYAIDQANKLTRIQLSPPHFNFDTKLLLSELTKPTLLLLDNPNNPTGKIILKNDLVEKILQNRNTLVVIDEAYYEFSGQTFAGLIKKYPNLAITRTMDKAFSLAGLRLGYLLMGDYFINYFSDFPKTLATPTLFAAIEALKNPEYLKINVTKILREKVRIEKEFIKIGIQVFSGNTNFILIRTEMPVFAERLRKQGILIKDLSDEWLSGYYRISLGLPEENDALLSIIKKQMAMPEMGLDDG